MRTPDSRRTHAVRASALSSAFCLLAAILVAVVLLAGGCRGGGGGTPPPAAPPPASVAAPAPAPDEAPAPAPGPGVPAMPATEPEGGSASQATAPAAGPGPVTAPAPERAAAPATGHAKAAAVEPAPARVAEPPAVPAPAVGAAPAEVSFVEVPTSGPSIDPAPPPIPRAELGSADGPPETASAAPPSDASSALTVDRERGEVRIPCWFVNPTRLLEVFACHEQGPTHETVVAFRATGPDLYRALHSLGLRGARYWNGTSPDDFFRTQGDRVVALVRWLHGGVVHEHPAEAMLLDGRTGFPAFVRGFSLATRSAVPEASTPASPEGGAPDAGAPDAAAAPDEPVVAEVVEITLGASNRQSPAYSLLMHPTNFPRMLPWCLPPELDPAVVRDHAELVEKKVPAELILRRVASEVDLLRIAQASDRARGLEERAALQEAWIPIAAEIDGLKKEYESLLGEIRKLIATGGKPDDLGDAEKKARAEQGIAFFRRGRWLSARIEERYIRLYGLQEEAKAAWAEGRTDLLPEDRTETLVLVRRGFAFEPRLAEKRVELAALELSGADVLAGERNLRREILRKESDILESERQARLADANLEHVRSRIAALEPDEEYLRELLAEDVRHFQAAMRAEAARQRRMRTEIAEAQGVLDGSWESRKAGVLAERARIDSELRMVGLEEQLNGVLSDIRWAKSDLASGLADRESDARERLEASTAKQKELEAAIAEIRKQLGE